MMQRIVIDVLYHGMGIYQLIGTIILVLLQTLLEF